MIRSRSPRSLLVLALTATAGLSLAACNRERTEAPREPKPAPAATAPTSPPSMLASDAHAVRAAADKFGEMVDQTAKGAWADIDRRHTAAKAAAYEVRSGLSPAKAAELDRALAEMDKARKEENRAAFALAGASANLSLLEARTETLRADQIAGDRLLNAARRYAALAAATPMDPVAMRAAADDANAQWALAAPGLSATAIPNGLQGGLTDMRTAATSGDRQGALRAADVVLNAAAKVNRDLNPTPQTAPTVPPRTP